MNHMHQPLSPRVKNSLHLVAVLSSLGMLITAYLIYQHYKPAGDSFCNISDFVSCDVVNKSIYAEILGIPVSILGFLTYGLIAALVGALLRGWDPRHLSPKLSKQLVLRLLALVTWFGLAFSLYLTAIELFVLTAICIFCVAQQILILLISLLFIPLWNEKSPSSS